MPWSTGPWTGPRTWQRAFDADLAAALSPSMADDHLVETVSYAYELARKPSLA
ncbi:hypothetical protein ACWC2T_15445 [Streptomyces sp. NPDC001393]